MRDHIVKSSDHIIVCGFGKLARKVCDDLRQDRVEVVVVEASEEDARAAAEEGLTVILGDATEEEALRRAGCERARGVALLLPTDAENLLAALTVKQINPETLTVVEGNSPRIESRLLHAGVDQVINPTSAAGRRIAHAFVRPAVIDLMDMTTRGLDPTIRVREIPIRSGSPLCGQAIKTSRVRENLNILIVALLRSDGSVEYNPTADSVLSEGSTLVAVGPLQNLRQLHGIGRGERKESP